MHAQIHMCSSKTNGTHRSFPAILTSFAGSSRLKASCGGRALSCTPPAPTRIVKVKATKIERVQHLSLCRMDGKSIRGTSPTSELSRFCHHSILGIMTRTAAGRVSKLSDNDLFQVSMCCSQCQRRATLLERIGTGFAGAHRHLY